MSKFYAIIFSLVILLQTVNAQQIENIEWFPIKTESLDQIHNYPYFSYHTILLKNSNKYYRKTIGTGYQDSLTYKQVDSHIFYLFDMSDSIKVNILELNDSILKIQFNDQVNVSYIPIPKMNIGNQVKTLKNLLSSKAWKLNNHSILEFNNNLDKSYIKSHLHNFLYDLHVFTHRINNYSRHIDHYYGIGYHGQSNVLAINELYDFDMTKNIIIQNISPNKIIGYHYDVKGKKVSDTLTAIPNIKNQRNKLIGTWQITDVEEFKADLIDLSNESSYFEPLKGITVDEFESKQLKIKLLDDSRYQVLVNDSIRIAGYWRLLKSKQIVQLSPDNKIQGKSYFTILELNQKLKILNSENLTENQYDFKTKKFIETYVKLKD